MSDQKMWLINLQAIVPPKVTWFLVSNSKVTLAIITVGQSPCRVDDYPSVFPSGIFSMLSHETHLLIPN